LHSKSHGRNERTKRVKEESYIAKKDGVKYGSVDVGENGGARARWWVGEE